MALCLTGCAAVAVLGARRPGVGPWNFVVLALLAVNMLPLAESLVRGVSLELDALRSVCVSATIAVGVLNYLPTRFAPSALLLLAGCGLEACDVLMPWRLQSPPIESVRGAGCILLGLVPWTAWAVARTRAASAFDATWLDFRDRFGLVWGQRLREQFNRSAHHAGWPVLLRWQGLRHLRGTALPSEAEQTVLLDTLRALLKRFGPPGQAA
jgi:hypothetical protein